MRVLIVSADIGAGHDLPAALLAGALRARGAEVVVADGLRAMGPVVRGAVRSGAETVLRRMPWLFQAQYGLVTARPRTRELSQALVARLGGPGLLVLIAAERPDAIVSTYPGTTEALGRLRADRRLGMPVSSAITDLAALRYWAHPGVDQHLLIHEESRAEVEAIIGRSDGIHHVRGLVRPEYEHPPARRVAREALGLAQDRGVVLASGGGWGVGRVEAAVAVARSVTDAEVVALCGSNERLRDRLAGQGVHALAFTDRMCEWMAAADVLIHSTAGLTMLEAQLCGTHAISFGWGVGHIQANNRAYRAFGLADVAGDETELAALLPGLLERERPADLDLAALPAAADLVLALTSPAP
jgi:processive 1,2-diacylglycerol beta-glucosyltransferase